jgi:hypothetical protein
MDTTKMLLFLVSRGWVMIPLGMSNFGPGLAYSGTARPLAIEADHQALDFALAPHKLAAPQFFILLLVYCFVVVLQIGFSLRIG